MFDSLAELGNYQIDIYGLPLFFLSFGVFFFGAFTMLRERFIPVTISLFLLTTSIANWLFSFAFLYWSKNYEQALVWANIGYLTIPLIAPAAYLFVCQSLGIEKKRRSVIFLGFCFAAVFIFLQGEFNLIFNGLYHYFWGYYPKFYSGVSAAFVLFFWVYIVLGLKELVFEYYKWNEKSKNFLRIRLMTLASLLACAAVVDSFPNYGFGIYPIGYLAVALVMLILLSVSKKIRSF